MSIQYLNSHISVRAYDKTIEAGYIEDSRKPRSTEIDAIQLMRWGYPIPATDTIGEALRAGKCRCARCQQFKDKADFSTWTKKETGVVYRKNYCKRCRADMDRTKRWSNVTPLEVEPRRAG